MPAHSHKVQLFMTCLNFEWHFYSEAIELVKFFVHIILAPTNDLNPEQVACFSM